MDLLETMGGYRRVASWAVWETDDVGALTGSMPFPQEQATPVVHGRAMFVSLNPGSDHAAETADATPDWANFHSPKPIHNDRFLAYATIGTPFWGSYMADLHPEIAESDSRLISSRREDIELKVRALISQAALLGDVETIVAVGGASYESVAQHTELIERETGVPRERIIRIPHYSQAAARVHGRNADRYRALVHEALGL